MQAGEASRALPHCKPASLRRTRAPDLPPASLGPTSEQSTPHRVASPWTCCRWLPYLLLAADETYNYLATMALHKREYPIPKLVVLGILAGARPRLMPLCRVVAALPA